MEERNEQPAAEPQKTSAYDSSDYAAHAAAYQQTHHRRSRRPLIIAIIVAIAILASGGYMLLGRHNAKPAQRPTNTATSQTNVPANNSPASGTQHYVSNGKDLNLEFDYPSNWTVTPSSNSNPNDQTITAESPLTTITNVSGASTTGKVTVLVRPVGTTMSELSSVGASAALDSNQFAYTHPTASQHQYPFLTYLHFTNGSTVAGSFEEVVITGTQQFRKGDAISADSIGADPLISASFYTCANTTCTGKDASPLAISADTWQNATLFQQVQALFASLKFN